MAAIEQQRRWQTRDEASLTPETLQKLFDNEIPLIRIPFAARDECDALAKSLGRFEDMVRVKNVEAPSAYIGVNLIAYRQGEDRKDEYFAAVPAAAERQQSIFARAFDPYQRMIEQLNKVNPAGAGTAVEEGYGEYCPIIIRHASGGLHLHCDYAPYNSPNWSVGKIDAQITWNLYVQQPKSGGETTVHNLQWTPPPGETELAQRGLPGDLPDGVESVTFSPTQGDVVFFNSRNPHSVAAGVAEEGHNRISAGSFVGRQQDGTLISWA
jgi:hypothetical protein